MIDRRSLLTSTAALLGSAVLLRQGSVRADDAPAPIAPSPGGHGALPRVVTPNGMSLPWRLENGVKVFHLVAEPVKREFAPGMVVDCWGYNGLSPGPTIEAVEGDRVRLLLTNRLPERTSVHWHGALLPNGMDGVAGLTQPHIEPGETYAYEFTLRQQGTLLYHPHSDEMVQIALGMMGFFVIHPRTPENLQRDYAILLHEWAIAPGTSRPNPMVMTDFNIFTLNSRVWPGTAPLVVKTGDRVRVRLGNISMDNHPMHLHGHRFEVSGTEGGPTPAAGRWRTSTVEVPVGSTRDIDFVADAPGDWPFHCHKSHHTMNAMSHELPNMLGVKQGGVEERVKSLLPGYMAMGEKGMGDMMSMGLPKNTLPMMAGQGPFGPVQMGGMFTLLKVRDELPPDADGGWYHQPAGTQARKV